MFDGDLSAASWTANSLAPVRFLPDAQICVGGGGGAQLDPQLIRPWCSVRRAISSNNRGIQPWTISSCGIQP
jgi:hypothetical protein